MKKLLIIMFLSFEIYSAVAQNHFSGNCYDLTTLEDAPVYFDREFDSVIQLKGLTYKTTYRVFDENENETYRCILINDTYIQTVNVIAHTNGLGNKTYSQKYEPENCGLILAALDKESAKGVIHENDLDTLINTTNHYSYLLSFKDTFRTYLYLHKVKTAEEKFLVLDKLSAFRLKSHNEVASALLQDIFYGQSAAAERQQKEEQRIQDSLQAEKRKVELARTEDSLRVQVFKNRIINAAQLLYERYKADSLQVKQCLNQINEDIAVYIPNAKEQKTDANDNKVFGLTKVKGAYEGTGLMQTPERSLLSGTFTNGKFVAGNAREITPSGMFTGQYANGLRNGIGWYKLKNGNYLLGNYVQNKFMEGISFWVDTARRTYLGQLINENERTGFGKLKLANGDMQFGIFEKGELLYGYSKETGSFGNTSFFKYDNRNKTYAEKEVFDEALNRIKTLTQQWL